jgi:hypothetical protein
MIEISLFLDDFLITIFTLNLGNFGMFDAALFKLSAQKHNLGSAFFTTEISFDPLFHRIKDDGGTGGMGQLVVFETEGDLGFREVQNLKIHFDGPLGDGDPREGVRKLSHELVNVSLYLFLEPGQEHETVGPKRYEFVYDFHTASLHK